ncbi:hypothetical protein HELRODRAFT_176278 [Helobdella robusta]|uniref:Uncharacterized protein n=1 Tax=Helobdella robusta TaxID=6412 RepID=T1FAD1_HELRO|nr:hypothetical protein HELRODRAFT_176278 [Helobdella robusta]ESN99977.1 hypothetical protein HELRODRAFT_176278 [Helobdella robusta]
MAFTSAKQCQKREETWRNRSFKNINLSRKLTSSFREHPNVPESACSVNWSESENLKIEKFSAKVNELIKENQKSVLDLNLKRKALRKIFDSICLSITGLDKALKINEASLSKRLKRPYFEKFIPDCPESYLNIENVKLKDLRCVLLTLRDGVTDQLKVFNSLHIRLNDFVEKVKLRSKVFNKRFKYDVHKCQTREFFCPYSSEKLDFDQNELDHLTKFYCLFNEELNMVLQKNEEFKRRVESILHETLSNRAFLFKFVNEKIEEKMKSTQMMKNCAHLKSYVESTGNLLKLTKQNSEKLKLDHYYKLKALSVDDQVLHYRRGLCKTI